MRPQDGTELLEATPSSDPAEIPEGDLSRFVDDVVEYIAGYLARNLQENMRCVTCAEALSTAIRPETLTSLKDNGSLLAPSQGVLSICRRAETIIRDGTLDSHRFLITVMDMLDPFSLFPQLIVHHYNTMDGIDSHLTTLTRLILTKFYNIRQKHISKEKNNQAHARRIRNLLTNSLHYRHHQ